MIDRIRSKGAINQSCRSPFVIQRTLHGFVIGAAPAFPCQGWHPAKSRCLRCAAEPDAPHVQITEAVPSETVRLFAERGDYPPVRLSAKSSGTSPNASRIAALSSSPVSSSATIRSAAAPGIRAAQASAFFRAPLSVPTTSLALVTLPPVLPSF